MSSTSTTVSLWQSTNAELKNLFPVDVYEMWFSELVCSEETDKKLVLTTKSEFNAIWIENNYLDIILQQVRSFAGTAIEVLIEVAVPEESEKSSSDGS